MVSDIIMIPVRKSGGEGESSMTFDRGFVITDDDFPVDCFLFLLGGKKSTQHLL